MLNSNLRRTPSRQRTLWTVLVATSVALLAAGCPWDKAPNPPPNQGQPSAGQQASGPPTTQPTTAKPPSSAGLTGTWKGTWQTITPNQSAGTFTLMWQQNGSQLSGTITVEGSPCLSSGTISGTVNGSQISFGAVQGQSTVSYSGTVAGTTMSGTYSTDCGNAQGSWAASKV